MVNRRTLLRGLAVIGAASGLPARAAEPAPTGIFRHGVASGDPDRESVVLWTRVSEMDGVTSVPVDWELAADSAFSAILDQGTVHAKPERDYTVKAIARPRRSEAPCWYRFRVGDVTSPIGRTRVLPSGQLDALGIAVASCSNYPFGHFNAYQAIASDPSIHVVVHLGDYLYEYGADDWGGGVGRELGRLHDPEHEMVSLGDYRRRHAQYKSDAGSQAMHAAHPLIAIWDDHESTNNPWVGGAENHQPDTEGDWSARRRASLTAYYEWMPVREPAPGAALEAYWRHYEFGELASLITLETRHTGRDRQIEYSGREAELVTPEDARRFERDVLGAPGRRMLSADGEKFLAQALEISRSAARPWRVIGNQIPMARVRVPDISKDPDFAAAVDAEAQSALARLRWLGRLDLPIYLDTWDGYPAAREAFYATCRAAGATDLLVITGDSHAFWTNRLADAEGRAMGLELGTAGITSPGDFEELGRERARAMDRLLAAHNPEVEWTDDLHRGYVRLCLGRQDARADFVAVSNVRDRYFETKVVHSVAILREDDHLRFG